MKPLGLVALVGIAFCTPCEVGWGARPTAKPIGDEAIELPLKEGTAVFVIAMSPSTAETARNVLDEKRWTTAKSAVRIPVVMAVVRSSLSDPLADRYDTVEKIRSAAHKCPNQNGPGYHVYLYIYYLDEGVYLNVDHWSFKADAPKKTACFSSLHGWLRGKKF